MKRPCRFCQAVRYIAIVIAIIAWYALVRAPIGPEHPMPTSLTRAQLIEGTPRNTPAFTLIDQHGDAFDHTQLRSDWAVVAFAYRGCSDACPATLAAMTDAQTHLLDADASAAKGAWVVVTLDPDADTPAAWGRYLGGFSDILTGLTGDVRSLTRLVAAITDGGTPIPGQAWLLAPGGAVSARFDPPIDADSLAADIRFLRQP